MKVRAASFALYTSLSRTPIRAVANAATMLSRGRAQAAAPVPTRATAKPYPSQPPLMVPMQRSKLVLAVLPRMGELTMTTVIAPHCAVHRAYLMPVNSDSNDTGPSGTEQQDAQVRPGSIAGCLHDRPSCRSVARSRAPPQTGQPPGLGVSQLWASRPGTPSSTGTIAWSFWLASVLNGVLVLTCKGPGHCIYYVHAQWRSRKRDFDFWKLRSL